MTPNQLRWLPPEEVDEGIDFVDALFTVCGSGKYVLPFNLFCKRHMQALLTKLVSAMQPPAERGLCHPPLHGNCLHARHQPHKRRRRLPDRTTIRCALSRLNLSALKSSYGLTWHQLKAVQAYDRHLPGTLHIRTEFGRLEVPSGHICIVQCGMRFSVDLADQECVQGYVLEVFGQHFTLPELGPIGESL